MFSWIETLPLWTANAAAMGLFALILIVCWSLPADFIWSGSKRVFYKDLRIWATLLVAIQILIYCFV